MQVFNVKASLMLLAAREHRKMRDDEVGSVRASSRKNRVYVLREFLLETYGDYLSPGDVVLDVAGGKGDLSWLLTNVHALTSIVVDPRVTTHRHLVKSINYLRAHPEQARLRAIPNRPTHQPLAVLLPKLDCKGNDFVDPKHFRIRVDDTLVQAVSTVKSDPVAETEWKTYWEAALKKGLDADMLGYKEEATETCNQVIDAFEAWSLLERCRLVVGFHPDQATDYCIDLALELGIPYCVVPCCVFPAEFPHRRLQDGSRVRDYQGLLDYLKRKDSSMQMTSLSFHDTTTAKNTVLYTLPKS